jgi:hypothetical protein
MDKAKLLKAGLLAMAVGAVMAFRPSQASADCRIEYDEMARYDKYVYVCEYSATVTDQADQVQYDMADVQDWLD